MNPSYQEKIAGAFWFVLTLVFAAIVFFPYYWMFVSSVETESMFSWPPHLIPSGFTLESYWTIFEERAIGRWFINTVIVAGSTSLFSTIIAINAAYALSRFKTKTTSIFTILIAPISRTALVAALMYCLAASRVDSYAAVASSARV